MTHFPAFMYERIRRGDAAGSLEGWWAAMVTQYGDGAKAACAAARWWLVLNQLAEEKAARAAGG